MKYVSLIVLIMLAKSITGFGQVWKSIDEPAFSIQYPEDWDVDRSGQMGMSFMLLSKQVSETDVFRENVNLLIQDLTGQNIDLTKFVSLSESQITTMLANAVVSENKKVETQKLPFQRMLFSGEVNEMKLTFRQYYWVQNDKAYILTLTCSTDQYETYRKTGEKIMDSFVLK